MYSEKDLFEEVKARIDAVLESGGTAQAGWVAHSVMQDHPGIEGADADFYTLCANKHVRSTVQKVLSRFKVRPDNDGDPQLILPGFKHLQIAYLVNRDGNQEVVRIENMTEAELRLKVVEYEAMGDGCYRHAREIERYIKLAEDAA